MPRKYNYKVPKGTKDCEGKECDKDYNFEIEIPDDIATLQQIPTAQLVGGSAQTQLLSPPAPQVTVPSPEPKKEEKKMSHDELAELIPEGVNYSPCPGGDCDHKKLENPKQTTKFVSCPSCSDNSNKKGTKFCKTCGKGPKENEEDYWEDSDIQLEEEE